MSTISEALHDLIVHHNILSSSYHALIDLQQQRCVYPATTVRSSVVNKHVTLSQLQILSLLSIKSIDNLHKLELLCFKAIFSLPVGLFNFLGNEELTNWLSFEMFEKIHGSHLGFLLKTYI